MSTQLTLFDMPPSLKEIDEAEDKFRGNGVGYIFSRATIMKAYAMAGLDVSKLVTVTTEDKE